MKRIILCVLYLLIVMFPYSASSAQGDIDNNGNITLQDAIMAIRITSNMDAGAQVYMSAEVNGDNKIGTAEAIYILQCISGLRLATVAKVTLDAAGTVQSTVTVAGPGGSQLTLYAGTRIALIGELGDVQAPASLDTVYLSLANETGVLPSLPSGITALTQLRIVLTIDGVGRDASFWPTSTSGTAEQGLKLVVVVTDQNVNDGTLGLLYEMASGSAVRVGSSALKLVGGATTSAVTTSLRVPLDSGTSGSGSRQMQFNPSRTGSYATGGSAPGSGSAPEGAFWSSFTVPDPGCITVGTTQVCGPSRVDRIEITEESTADILGMCWFGENNAATTGSIPPGYQFWCERSPNASGGGTDIKISSMQANLPLIHTYLVRASDGLPMWETYIQPTGGLHGPDGAVYTDPYQKKEFEFAGYKKLTFTTTADKKYDWMRQHALIPLQNAGYTANLHSFTATSPGFIAEIGVYDTLDARVLMEEDVILKEPWKVRKGDATQGNRGTYDYTPKYKGTAKASLKWSNTESLVYEIGADVTFEKDTALSTELLDVYTASGTITQTNYTVPMPVCSGEPASFTDAPYPIAKGPYGDLWIKKGSNPIEYVASATLSADTYPLQSHPYRMCCGSQCSDEVLEPGAQEHMWLMTGLGGAFKTAESDGRLKGTFEHVQQVGTYVIKAGLYEWDFAPADENP